MDIEARIYLTLLILVALAAVALGILAHRSQHDADRSQTDADRERQRAELYQRMYRRTRGELLDLRGHLQHLYDQVAATVDRPEGDQRWELTDTGRAAADDELLGRALTDQARHYYRWLEQR